LLRKRLAWFRELPAADPAHQFALAEMLQSRAGHLENLDRWQEALVARRDAVDLYGELAGTDPTLYDETYKRELASLRRRLDLHGYEVAGLGLDLDPKHVTNDQPKGNPPSTAADTS